jgi:hypothetical protein
MMVAGQCCAASAFASLIAVAAAFVAPFAKSEPLKHGIEMPVAIFPNSPRRRLFMMANDGE